MREHSAWRRDKLGVDAVRGRCFRFFMDTGCRSRFGCINRVGWSMGVVECVQFYLLGVLWGRRDGLRGFLLL